MSFGIRWTLGVARLGYNLAMDPDTRVKLVLLLLLIGALGLLGIAMLGVLTTAWKRFNARNRAVHEPNTRPDEPPIDAWQLSGKRLTGDAPPAPSKDDDLFLHGDFAIDDPIIDEAIDEVEQLSSDDADGDEDPMIDEFDGLDDDDEDEDDEDEDDEDEDEQRPPFGRFPF